MGIAYHRSRLVIVGGDAELARSVAAVGAMAGWEVATTELPLAVGDFHPPRSGAAAILVDARHNPIVARDFVSRLSQSSTPLPSFVVTSGFSAARRAEFLRAGAVDCFAYPFDRDQFLRSLRVGTSNSQPKALQPLAHELAEEGGLEGLVGSEPAFREALAIAAKAARAHVHLVIEGEAGTGKELLARAVHAASPRRNAALEIVRPRGLTAAELQSALLGHEAGARIGAFSRQRGALERCDGGTLILREVNRLPRDIQEQLAGALTSSRGRPLGASYSFEVNVRVLATATQPLSLLVERGEFALSLYAALAAVEVRLPPLRDRKRDIPALARHFLRGISRQSDLGELTLADSALTLLCTHDWPGNVGQLQAVIVRAAAACPGEVLKPEHFADLRAEDDASAQSIDGAGGGDVLLFGEDGHLRPLRDIEQDVIRLAIGMYGGRMSEVARRLGIGRSTLYRKIEGLDPDAGAAND